MKYIMYLFIKGHVEQYMPFTFPSIMVHEDMHNLINNCEHFAQLRSKGFDIQLVSAGDYDVTDCITSGKSETLSLSSKKGDADIIASYKYLHGII